MKIGILASSSKSFKFISDITFKIMKDYAIRWEIEYNFPEYPSESQFNYIPQDQGFGRIDMLRQWIQSYDWLWWMGADVMLMNHTIDVRNFIDPDADLIARIEENGLQNDVMLLRNCPQIISFLEKVQARKEKDSKKNKNSLASTEQGAMVCVLAGIEEYLNDLPASALSASEVRFKEAPPTFNKIKHPPFEHGDFVYHAAGMPLQDKYDNLLRMSASIIK
jgi:hypothetical protein